MAIASFPDDDRNNRSIEDYIKSLQSSNAGTTIVLDRMDASLEQIKAATSSIPELNKMASESSKNINELKELVKAIKASNEEMLAIMQKDLDNIKVPEDNTAVSKRLEIDKANNVLLKDIVDRLDKQIKSKEKDDLKAAKKTQLNEMRQQRQDTEKNLLIYRFFGLFEGLVNGVKNFENNLKKDFLPLMFALFGKNVITWGKNLFTALKIPAILVSLGEMSSIITKGISSISNVLKQWTKAGRLLIKNFSTFGKNATEIWKGTKVGSTVATAGSIISKTAAKTGSVALDFFSLLREKIADSKAVNTIIDTFSKIEDFTTNVLSKISSFSTKIVDWISKTRIDSLIESAIMKIDDFGLAISKTARAVSKTFQGFIKLFKNAGRILSTVTDTTKIGGIVTKTFGKQFLKKLPVIGSVISLFDAFMRFNQGDKIGGTLDILSAIGTLLGPVGIGVSFVIDLVNLARDSGFAKVGQWLENITGENIVTKALKTSPLFNSNYTGKVGDGEEQPYITSSTADVSYMNPKFKNNFLAAARDMYKSTGKKPIINSAFRSNRKQAELWYRGNVLKEKGIFMPARPAYDEVINGYLVKGNGKSKRTGHMVGAAVDIENWQTFRPFAQKHGLHWMGMKDKVHFQINDSFQVPGPTGISSDSGILRASATSKDIATMNEPSEGISGTIDITADEPLSIQSIFDSAMQELANLQNIISGNTASGTPAPQTSAPATTVSQAVPTVEEAKKKYGTISAAPAKQITDRSTFISMPKPSTPATINNIEVLMYNLGNSFPRT